METTRYSGVAVWAVAALLLSLTAGACDPQAPDGLEGPAGPDSSMVAIPSAAAIPAEEYPDRRARVMAALPDGVLLLHARSAGKEMEQWGFIQDPSFFYFSGLGELPGAILALDGVARTSTLFLPPAPMSFGYAVEGVVPLPGSETAVQLGLDEALSWDTFEGWLNERLASGVTTLFVDEPRRSESTGMPQGFQPTAGPLTLWRLALEDRFPTATVRGARHAILPMRWKKSPAEIAILRRNAQRTATALMAVARWIEPGMTQRAAEATVVSTCIETGGQGPSFWPWVMSGPNARVGGLVAAFFRYEQLDRTMQSGELARVDIGCAGGFYGGDVGRTFPVSGTYTTGQREAWNLLIDGYRAGLEAMAPGVALDVVRDASAAAIEAARENLQTDMGREAAEAILAGGRGTWHIHGVGIESGEDPGDRLVVGAVLAYEPGFEIRGDAFYLEDMIGITESGHEVLSDGLPYTAEEIETVMAAR